MMIARGASLGLGRLDWNDLHSSRPRSVRSNSVKLKGKKETPLPHKASIQVRFETSARKVPRKPCIVSLVCCVIFMIGVGISVVGFFDEQLATYQVSNNETVIDQGIKWKVASLGYIGPVIMAIGAFILMVAFVRIAHSCSGELSPVLPCKFRTLSPKDANCRATITQCMGIGHKSPQSDSDVLTNDEVENSHRMERTGHRTHWVGQDTGHYLRDERHVRRHHRHHPSHLFIHTHRPNDELVFLEQGLSPEEIHASAIRPTRKKSRQHWEKFSFKKYPSASCVPTLVKRVNTRELLLDFLGDQWQKAENNNERNGPGESSSPSEVFQNPLVPKVTIRKTSCSPGAESMISFGSDNYLTPLSELHPECSGIVYDETSLIT